MDCNVYDNDCHFTDQMLPLLWVLLMLILMLMLFHQFCNVSKTLRAYWNTSINFSDGMQNLNTFGSMERFYLQYCTLFHGILLSVFVPSFRFHFVSIQLKNVQIRIVKVFEFNMRHSLKHFSMPQPLDQQNKNSL